MGLLRARVSGGIDIKRNSRAAADSFEDSAQEANVETAEAIITLALANLLQIDAYDTAELYDSADVRYGKGNAAAAVFTAKHAPYIEFGTAPHFPPLDKIRAWCGRKGIPESAAFPIARRISERGTPERPYFRPAVAAESGNHLHRVKVAIYNGLKKVLPAA